MKEAFLQLSPLWQALLATGGTWLLTAMGALGVLFVVNVSRRLLDASLGMAAGVMVAASCWSLLVPAMERGGLLPACVGLGVGALFIIGLDRTLPHLHIGATKPEGLASGRAWRRTLLLVLAVTIHNLPEGLAVGVSFAGDDAGPALALAIGIGLQNIPEGLAVALPLRREGLSRWQALFWGQASALVEPLGGLIGVTIISVAQPLLPYGLAFAAGAMLYVVVEELLPEANGSDEAAEPGQGKHGDVVTIGFIVGFGIMMALDNAVG